MTIDKPAGGRKMATKRAILAAITRSWRLFKGRDHDRGKY
jgi:hypothetical protein